jgi:hypothetical protein
MDAVDTFTHAALLVRILWEEYVDENDNPRSFDGNMGVMFCDYRGYTLGDIDAEDPREHTVECEVCDGSGENRREWHVGIHRTATPLGDFTGENAETEAQAFLADLPGLSEGRYYIEPGTCPKCEGEGELEVGIVDYLVREHGAKVVLPLFVYEHSGITMRAGANLVTNEDNMRSTDRFVGDAAGWDTSTVGVIFDTKQTHTERGDADDLTVEQITEALQSEVAYYAAYLEGSVFGYQVVQVELDEDDEPVDDGEVLDSCWGFLELNVHKDDAYVRTAAKEAAECCARQIIRERELAADAAARDIITI